MTRFRILSLDGGGIKGTFTAAVVATLEKDTGKSAAEYFDLITGTSTGGIIAIGLGLGLSAVSSASPCVAWSFRPTMPTRAASS